MKQTYEFDAAVQEPAITQANVAQAINTYATTNALVSLAVHERRSIKSKKLTEGFITWGEGELTEQQVTDVEATLASTFGLVGYTSAAPDPFILLGGGINRVNGLVCGSALPVITSQFTYAIAVYYCATTDPRDNQPAGHITNVGAGNEWTYDQDNMTMYPATILEIYINQTAGVTGSQVLTIPQNALLTIKDAIGTELVISRQKDIVITSAALPSNSKYYIGKNGNLYLCSRDDAVLSSVYPMSYEQAVQGQAW